MGQPSKGSRADRSGNLPAELTSFVGRQRELGQVADALSASRLVSLVGPGGVGKTRLAARTATRVARAFPDGTWLIELGALRDPALLTEHIAATLGLRDESGRWLVATLSDYLARRRLLLILDNCEHLLDATAALVRALLQQGSELRILATSREPLGLTAESLVHVLPLDADGPALHLLVDRAAAVRPGFQLTDATRPAAVELCRRLDGIPLAIELAAARLRGMALGEIVGRLDQRLSLLTGGDRSGPRRQQTLRATLDWSYELLTEQERALWRRLAPFAGDFDVEAAVAVTADGDVLPPAAVADVLARLVERSLVQLSDPIAGRYRVLETVREYAAERAAEHGERDEFRARHRDHYLALAAAASQNWATREQVAWFRRLSADYDNLREALDACRASSEGAERGLEIASRLRIAWQATGRFAEGQRWITTFLDAVPARSRVRPLGLWAAGYMAVGRDPAAAEKLLTEARELAVEFDDEETEAWAISNLGLARLFAGDPAEARGLFLESVARHREGGRRGVAAFMLADAALAATFLGDTDATFREIDESLAVSRQVGDQWTESHALWVMGVARLERGEAEEADTSLRESLRLIREVGDVTGTALAVEAMAVSAAEQGQHRRAASLAGLADNLWDSMPGWPPGPARALRERAMGAVRAALGDSLVDGLVAAARSQEREAAIAWALDETAAAATAVSQAATPVPAGPRLSRREVEVATLVAEGLTNRDIAHRLVLSPRTVESHVERIMNRLGVGSRTEIAAWTARNLSGTETADIP
jgi:predicted ATPase/DNA-binding CsgD family transcriptional regulator